MRATAVCVVCAVLLGAPSPSAALGEATPSSAPRATPGRNVIVALPDCERTPYDATELWAALTLELGQRGLAAERDRSQTPDVSIELPSCEPGDETLRLHVVGTPGAASLNRQVALLETPFEARARLLALLIAESIPEDATAPPEPRSVSAQAHETFDSEVVGEPREASTEHGGIHLGAALRVRSSVGELQPFWGAEANLRVPVWGSLDWVAEAGLAARTEETWLGDLDVRWWSLTTGVDWSSRSDVEWRVGPRLSLAYVSASSEATLAAGDRTQTDQLVLLGGRTALGLPVGRSAWQVSVTLDAQRALRGLVLMAGGTESVALDAWILGAGVGLGYEL